MSGTWRSSSSPRPPCPATTSGSSNGCTNARPPSSARSRAAATASSTVSPTRRTCAPRALAASSLEIVAPLGMNTSQAMPRARAAYATAWAWLPALPHTTPASQRSPSEAILANAPRSLNDPVRWRFSALSATGIPVRSASVRELSTGVSRMISPPASAARWTSWSETDPRPPPAGPWLIAVVSVRERHHRVHLHLRAPRKRGHPDRHASRGA
jgi:hypothetical protein